ncbi:MAG TPA: EI24 domain-containing protein [Azospirillaceae bacterium]|nr:EI24 domain-containing protein [Azospirillaceae bacterium]
MIRALLLAIGQLPEPAVFGVVLKSVVATVLLAAGLVAGIGWLLYESTLFQQTWLDSTVDVLGGLGAAVLAWLLFPGFVVAISGLFLERVAKAVERRHYRHLPPPRDVPLSQEIASGVKFIAITVGLNLLILPLLFVFPVYLAAFYLLNGYLLGREYFEMVAMRRIDTEERRRMQSRRRLGLFSAGIIIAFLSTLPFVNLLVPVLATAFMVHLFEGFRGGLPLPAHA